MPNKLIAGVLAALVSFAVASTAIAADPPRHAVRLDLKKAAAGKFKASANHCQTFGEVAELAIAKASNVADLLEDMRLVLIGEDWKRRKGKRGPYWIDVPTKDSGFKAELKDGSPQVEHAMAGIYFAKVVPPGAVTAGGAFTEFVGNIRKPNAADMLLFGYAEDLGGRVANHNMKDFPTALRRTLCQ